MRIVVKVGTSTLTYPNGNLNITGMEMLCKVLSDLKNAGHEMILVSSGAIGMGVGRLGLTERPEDMPGKQAAAAVGQSELMYAYDRNFSEYRHIVAQVLLTKEDMEDGKRKKNILATLERLLSLGALPIINENDAVATDEIAEVGTFGDNDTLSAVVAELLGADLLILLSDIDGLYSEDPHKVENAKLIPIVSEITEEIEKSVGGKGSPLATGGMLTKLKAARICMNAGCDMLIMNGNAPDKLYDAIKGEGIGTRFIGRK